jgi:hypothetical protein
MYDIVRGFMERQRQKSPVELRGTADPYDTAAYDAAIAAIEGAVEDPKGTAKTAASSLAEYMKTATGSPGGMTRFLAENLMPSPRLPRSPVMQEMITYQGSPYKFDPTESNPLGEFDVSKMGKGVGQQNRGPGTYIAENPKVASRYRIPGGRLPRDGSEPPRGYLYTADLPDEMVDKMIDLDAPIKNQPKIRDTLLKIADDGVLPTESADYLRLLLTTSDRRFQKTPLTGFGLIAVPRQFGGIFNDATEANTLLQQYGIPGSKWKDDISRGPSKGTRNFVVFPGEEKNLKILSREGPEVQETPVKRAEGSPETGETSQEELRRLMRLMNPDADQIEEAALAAPRVAGTVGAFGSGLMNQLRGLAALPGQALDFGRGTLQKIRELSPEELRGQAPAMDTESVDAFVAAAQRAKEDPKGEAAKALAAISDYLKQGTSSPEAFAQMLGENVPLPGPSRTRTPPVTRMAEESPPPGGPIRQFSGRLDNFVAGLSGPVRKDQFLGQLSNKFRNYEVERARQALAELPDDAKLTPQQLSERLSATLNPGDLTTKIIPPSAGGGFYQSYDNPYPDRPLGVIHLNKDIPIAPEDLAKVEAIERLRQEPLFKGGSFNLANIIYNPDPEQNQRVLTLLRESGAETPVTESTFRELVGQLDEVKRLANETRVPINRLSYYKTAVEAPGATDRNSDVVRFRPPTEDTPSFWEVQKNLKEGYVEADRAAGVLPDHFGHSKKASRLAKKIVFLDAIDNLIKMAEPAASKSPRFPRSASENLEYLKEHRAVIQEHPGWVQDPFYNPRANLPASSQNIFKKREKAFGDAELLVSLDDQLRLDSGGLGPSRDSKVFEAFTGVADSLFELEEAKADAAIRSASSALKGLVKHAEETAPRIYKGQHPTLLGGANPVAFSRFSEHTADIPELGNVKGIYVTELQSDLLQDVRRRGIKGRTLEMDNVELDQLAKEESALRKRLRTVPKLASGIRARLFDTDAVVLDEKQRKTLDSDLKQNLARQKVLKERVGRTKLEPKEAYQFFEPFANMETSPQILQQLLIKNTVGAAVQRGDSFVAFPGAQSKQAQLYENLPNNLKQVAKDLGPGFEVRLLTLPDSKGNPLTHPAVIWGPEAAARVAQKGVPFAKGGEVKTLATSPRPY